MERIVPLNDAVFAAQTTTYTGTAGTVTGWPAGPRGVWVVVTTPAYIRVGNSVTATTSDLYVPGNVPVVINVPESAKTTFTVSAIQVSTGGSVYAKPLQG